MHCPLWRISVYSQQSFTTRTIQSVEIDGCASLSERDVSGATTDKWDSGDKWKRHFRCSFTGAAKKRSPTNGPILIIIKT